MVELKQEQQRLTAVLSGEIDHHNARLLRERIDLAVTQDPPQELVLDFGQVTFMDSSGIGLVMGRHRIMQEHGGVVSVANPSPQIRKVMRLSGIDRLANIR